MFNDCIGTKSGLNRLCEVSSALFYIYIYQQDWMVLLLTNVITFVKIAQNAILQM